MFNARVFEVLTGPHFEDILYVMVRFNDIDCNGQGCSITMSTWMTNDEDTILSYDEVTQFQYVEPANRYITSLTQEDADLFVLRGKQFLSVL